MEEICDIVDELNDILFNENENCEKTFWYSSNGYQDYIYFDKIMVYDSDNSDRGWDEDKDDYERTINEQVLFELSEYIDDVRIITYKLKLKQ